MESESNFFVLADKILLLAKELEKQIGGTDAGYDGNMEDWNRKNGPYKMISSIILYSAADDFRAIFLLLQNNLLNGAFLSCRRLFELAVDLRFIGKKPDIRSKEFIMYDRIQQKEYLEVIEKYWAIPLEMAEKYKEQKEIIFRNYEEAMKSLNYKKPPRQWSCNSYRQKCKEIEWDKHYNIIYKLYSGYTHPSVRGLGNFLMDLPSGDLAYIQPENLAILIAPIAISSILDIISNVNKILNAGLETSINQIYQDLKNLGWIHM